MHNIKRSVYHVWRPELDEAARMAVRRRGLARIKSLMPLDECNTADVTLTGRFLGFNDYQAQFLVDSFDLSPTTLFPVAPECEYSFIVDIDLRNRSRARMEYGGRAFILDSDLQKNNLPSGLLLRLSHPTIIRRLRVHERGESDRLFMPGLMLIDQTPPTSRRALFSLLAHYYKDHARPKPSIINISAGGACLRTDDSYCQKFLGADENYLFFFFSQYDNGLKCPHVFICKKVGSFRDQTRDLSGLRVKFIRELIWTKPEDDLKWRDVNADGSLVLKNILESPRSDPDAPD